MIGIKWTPFNNSIYLGAQLRRSKLQPTIHMLRVTCYFFHWSIRPNDLRGNFGGVFVKVNNRNEVSSKWNHQQSSRPTFIKKSFCSMKYSSPPCFSSEISLKRCRLAASEGTIVHLAALMWKKTALFEWAWWSMAAPKLRHRPVPFPIILSSQMAKW